jgi:hypothetical protein
LFVFFARNNSSSDRIILASLFEKAWYFTAAKGKGISGKEKFKFYPIGYFHIDIAEVQTEEGRVYLFTAIDRTSKFAYAQLLNEATRATAKSFLECLIAAVP